MANQEVLLGQGVLTWCRSERISDRYGTVYLIGETENSLSPTTTSQPLARVKPGTRGTLLARVREARESTHIGDIFRGIFPETPEVGEEIFLGQGRIFFQPQNDIQTVGLAPEDGRSHDWLDPEALYRAHEQSVDLVFVPELDEEVSNA
jgi:hypothetical protein